MNGVDPSGEATCKNGDSCNIVEKVVEVVTSVEVAPNWQPKSVTDTIISNSQLPGDVDKASVGNAALENTAKGIVEATPEIGATTLATTGAVGVLESGPVVTLAGEKLAEGAAAASSSLGNAGRAVGQKLFGRGGKGILNRNSKIRVGYGWKGSKTSGKAVFRISVGKGKATKHFDLFDL